MFKSAVKGAARCGYFSGRVRLKVRARAVFAAAYTHNKSSFNKDSYYIKKTIIVTDSKAMGGGGGGGSGGSGGKNPFKSPKSGSGKEKATDVPSWAKGNRPYKNENGNQFAKRLCDERFGKGNYDKGPRSDFNRIRKWGDRGFE